MFQPAKPLEEEWSSTLAPPSRINFFREIGLSGERLCHSRRSSHVFLLQCPPGHAPPATAWARNWCSTRISSSRTTMSGIAKGAVVPWAKSNPPSPYYMQVLSSLRATLSHSTSLGRVSPRKRSRSSWNGTGGRPVTLRLYRGKKSYEVKKPFRACSAIRTGNGAKQIGLDARGASRYSGEPSMRSVARGARRDPRRSP